MKPSTNMAISLALAAFILVRVVDTPSLPSALMTLSALALVFLVMGLEAYQAKDDAATITSRVESLEKDIASLRSAINLKRQ